MAVELYPWAISAETYSAEVVRRAIDVMLARNSTNGVGTVAGGIVGTGDLLLTAPGSGLSVNVAAGECLVPGSASFASTPAGYYLRNTATLNLAIATASPSNPRIDLVCATINDATYHGSTNSGVIQVITGTPTTGATLTNLSGAAALPDASLLIGYVLVPTSATNIITGDIQNTATASVAAENTLTIGLPNFAPTFKSAGYTALPNDLVIATGSTFTVTSPPHRKGMEFAVVNQGSGAITVAAASGAIFGLGLGGGGAASIVVGAQGGSVVLQSDGANLNIVGGASGANYFESFIGSNAAITAGTLLTLTSGSLVAGTWDICGRGVIENTAGGSHAFCDLWIGPTSASASGAYAGGGGDIGVSGTSQEQNIAFRKIVTLAVTTTVYLNVEVSNVNCTALAATSLQSIPNATGITAVRLS